MNLFDMGEVWTLDKYESAPIDALIEALVDAKKEGALYFTFEYDDGYGGYIERAWIAIAREETPEETASRELEAKARQRAELQQREARERALLSSLSAKYGDRP